MNAIIEKFKIYGWKIFFSYATTDLKNKLIMQFLRNSYSQKGEDLVIDKLLNYKGKGFYVDVGANDPHRFSNTKRFYKKGWSGINIEPNFNNYQKFVRDRKDDINLNIGVGKVEGKLKFYKFTPDTLSTFSKEEANSYIKQGYKLEDVTEISVRTLAEILDVHCKDKKIDFMSIDTEGFDMKVLLGNDWDRFRPALICIESIVHNIKDKGIDARKDNHDFFLTSIGYKKVYNNSLNSIYVEWK